MRYGNNLFPFIPFDRLIKRVEKLLICSPNENEVTDFLEIPKYRNSNFNE